MSAPPCHKNNQIAYSTLLKKVCIFRKLSKTWDVTLYLEIYSVFIVTERRITEVSLLPIFELWQRVSRILFLLVHCSQMRVQQTARRKSCLLNYLFLSFYVMCSIIQKDTLETSERHF